MVVVLESLAFFELAVHDDLVDPEVAEENRDGAMHELRGMSDDERREFAEFARTYAEEEAKQDGTEERAEFFRRLAKELGGPAAS